VSTDIVLLAHVSLAEAEISARALKALGPRARSFLSECVEHQALPRRTASKVAEQLSDLGFIFIRDNSDLFHQEVVITPSLLGEEALDALEGLERRAKTAGQVSKPC